MGVFAGIEKNWASQLDTGRTHVATKGIVQSGLVLNLDAGVSSSYSGSGTTWTDLSGNGNNGTLTNGPTYNSANGGSIVFDGTDDRVTITNPLLSSTGNWTVSSWFNFSVLNIDLTNGSTAALYNQYIASTGNGRIVFRIFNDGSVINKLQLFLGSGSNYGNQFITGTTTITTNTFYNFVVSRNGSTFTTYINGVLEVSSTLTGINVTILQSTPEIGGITSGNFGWLNGRVYNTSIYNRALTEAEIQRNFQATRFRYGI
tara:strand:+ start:85 stop:861 length:777 start_codon:yes stop_codon:yes gene_type:complete